MNTFKLHSKFSPTGDQPQAITKLCSGLKKGQKDQTLLGVTGSGKTFTMANIIERSQRPALIISHNKTLAAQLAAEFKEFFPENAVHYFVSYYDYYQPEAYIPQSDTYIEKETKINEEIERLRHASTQSVLSRRDTIIVASVSCIYGLGNPKEYIKQSLTISIPSHHQKHGEINDQTSQSEGIGDVMFARGLSESEARVPQKKITSPVPERVNNRTQIINKLISMQYQRNDVDLHRGTFRLRGEILDIFPTNSVDHIIRITFFDKEVESIHLLDPLTGKKITNNYELQVTSYGLQKVTVFPATHYVAPNEKLETVIKDIRSEMETRVKFFEKRKKAVEAQRLRQKTTYDLEMIQTAGFCSGIENYSRYFDERKEGEPPFTLIDYFKSSPAFDPKDFLMFIDESHMTIPQIRAMYAGDQARKKQLIDYGFRLPSALDNRPLNFEEFEEKINQIIYVSATPGPYELEKSLKYKNNKTIKQKIKNNIDNKLQVTDYQPKADPPRADELRVTDGIAEQIIRPTGLLDPTIEVKPIENQIDNLLEEIQKRIKKKQRVLVTTLTKRMSEDLSDYLQEVGIKAYYLHSEIDTFERLEILKNLRTGKYDVIVGINLLREGLDLPEVSLIAILDADKEGFLRSETSFIQTIGRSARHEEGHVIMYADNMTGSMKRAISETKRRRKKQEAYNKKHDITPRSIKKEIRADLYTYDGKKKKAKKGKRPVQPLDMSLPEFIETLENQMNIAAENLQFEKAAQLRDEIEKLKQKK